MQRSLSSLRCTKLPLAFWRTSLSSTIPDWFLTPRPLVPVLDIRLYSSRAAKRMMKLGIGADGKPLPQPNVKKVFPRMYRVMLVNQDGSTYTIRHGSPLQIMTMPLDPSTLSEEEQRERERRRLAAKERVYVEEEELEEDCYDQSEYRGLIDTS